MTIITWNINGLQKAVANNIFDPLNSFCPDVICLQEIRTDKKLCAIPGWHHFYNHSMRPGYSGVGVISKDKPVAVEYGLGDYDEEGEARTITAEFDGYFIVCVYVPNSRRNLKRKAYRRKWDEAFMDYLETIEFKARKDEKQIVICGDFNVIVSSYDSFAKEEDMFATDEQDMMIDLFEKGYIDIFRQLYPEKRCYSAWNLKFNGRARNEGFRLDYFLVEEELKERVIDIHYLEEIYGSDHCPVLLKMA